MKPKAQIRYLLDKQVIEAEARPSIRGVKLLLSVVSSQGELVLTDGIHVIRARIAGPRKRNSRESPEAPLEPNSLYIFSDCTLKVEEDDVIEFRFLLHTKSAKLVMPHFGEYASREPKFLSEDLSFSERNVLQRRVS